MNRTQKTVVVTLAVIALLCLAVLARGLAQPACKGTPRQCAEGYAPGDGIQALGRLFSSAGPRIRLPRKRFEFNTAGTVGVDIEPRKDESGRMRTLKLRQVQGVIHLSLLNAVPDPDLDKQKEPTPLPRTASEPDDRHTLSFAVTHGGARLTIECVQAPCVLESE